MEISNRNIIFILIGIQICCTIPFISSHSISLDEPFSIFYAQQSIDDLFLLFKNENNPPLHFLLLHYWIKLFGYSPLAVRSLSLIFSLLTIPVLYKLGLKFLSKHYSFFLVLVFIFSKFNHYHALEARVYSIFVFLFVLIIYHLYEIIFEKKKKGFYLALWNTLLLYAHYLAPFVIFFELIIILIFIRKLDFKLIIHLFLSFIITLVLYSPLLTLFLIRLEHFSDNGTWVREPKYSELYGNILRFFNTTLAFFLTLLIPLFFFFKNHIKKTSLFFKNLLKPQYLYFFIFFLVPYLGMFIFSKLFQPIFLDRYLLFTSIPLYISYVIIIKEILNGIEKKWIYIIVLPLVFSVDFIPNNNREDNLLAEYVNTIKTSESRIVFCPPTYDLTFFYHENLEIFKDYKNFESNLKKNNYFGIYSFNDVPNESNKVIFVDAASTFLYPDNDILDGLDKNYTFIESKCFGTSYCVYHFKK